MLPKWVSLQFVRLVEYFTARRCTQIKFLNLQVELLKKKLGGNRIILAPEDRELLLRAGAEFDHAVHDVLGIVTVKTYKQWVRGQKTGKEAGRRGLAKTVRETRFTATLSRWRHSR